MAAVAPRLLAAIEPVEGDLRGGSTTCVPRSRTRRAHDRGDRPQRRAQVRPRHRAPRPRRQAARACRSATCWADRRAPADRLHARASTSRRSSPSGPAARRDFPALKIKVGGPSDLATLEAVRGRVRRADPGRRQHRLDARDALALLPELERLGVELIEQPFPARRLDQLRWLQERSSLPIVADESAVTIEDLDALVGVTAGVNVKLAKCGGVGPGAPDARARARARASGRSSAAWRRRRSGSPPRRPCRRSPTGSTSTAACCSPTTRSRGLELGAGQALAAARRPRPGPDAGRRGDALNPRAAASASRACPPWAAGVDKSVGADGGEAPTARRRPPPYDVGTRRRPDRKREQRRPVPHSSIAGRRAPVIARRPDLPPRARRERGPSSMLPASDRRIAHARSRGLRAVLLSAAARRLAGAV